MKVYVQKTGTYAELVTPKELGLPQTFKGDVAVDTGVETEYTVDHKLDSEDVVTTLYFNRQILYTDIDIIDWNNVKLTITAGVVGTVKVIIQSI